MTTYQRLVAIMALVSGGFAALIAVLPTWTYTLDEAYGDRTAWWDPVLWQYQNPFPLLGLSATGLGLVLVVVALARRRPTWFPAVCFGVAAACTIAGVLVHGRWFLVITGISMQIMALSMSLLMTVPLGQAGGRTDRGRA